MTKQLVEALQEILSCDFVSYPDCSLHTDKKITKARQLADKALAAHEAKREERIKALGALFYYEKHSDDTSP